jgi:hypothetical protein
LQLLNPLLALIFSDLVTITAMSSRDKNTMENPQDAVALVEWKTRKKEENKPQVETQLKEWIQHDDN